MNEAYQVPLLTLVFLYLFHTTGELFLSPIGLSMVTKLSPKKMTGTAMGGWFLSFAIANYLAGQIAALTGAEDGQQALSLGDQLGQYTSVFSTIGFVLLGISLLLMILARPLNKLMHGVK